MSQEEQQLTQEQAFDQAWDEITGKTDDTETVSTEAEEQTGEDESTIAQDGEASTDAGTEGHGEQSQAAAPEQQGTETSQDELSLLRKELAQLQEKFVRQGGQVRGYEQKHQAALKKLRELEDREKRIASAGSEEDALKALESEYPDIAAKLQKAFEAERAKAKQEAEALRAEIATAVQPVQEEMSRRTAQEAANVVFAKHPDAAAIVTSQGYRDWLAAQDEDVRALHTSPNPEHGVMLLDYFKATRGQATAGQAAAVTGKANSEQDSRRDRLAAMGAPGTTRQASRATGLPPADDFDAAFDYFARSG